MVRIGQGEERGERRACRREILVSRARMLRGCARRPVGRDSWLRLRWWWKVLGMPHEHPEYWLRTCLTYRKQPDMSLPGARRFHCTAPEIQHASLPRLFRVPSVLVPDPTSSGLTEIFLLRESADSRRAYQSKVDRRFPPRDSTLNYRALPPLLPYHRGFVRRICERLMSSCLSSPTSRIPHP